MKAPTERQRVVLREIRQHQTAKGYPISIRELVEVLGVTSTSGVADHLKALERKGLVSREKNRARTLQLTAAGRKEAGA